MLSQVTKLLSDKGVNIENMQSKSRKDVAYTVLDCEMCIRDRRRGLSAAAGPADADQSRLADGLYCFQLIHPVRQQREYLADGDGAVAPGAVSYTHLDVYKRQVPTRQGVHLPQDSSTVNSRKNLAISTIQVAVSYTHLDVYKRQGQEEVADTTRLTLAALEA